MIDQPERCTGSLQQTMTADSPSPCPSCGALVDVLLFDVGIVADAEHPTRSILCLIEHARRKTEALPIAFDFPED